MDSGKLKILIVSPWFHPHLERGGTPIAAYNFAVGLASLGNSVTVLTTSNFADRKFSSVSSYELENLKIFYANPALKFLPRSELMSFRLIRKMVRNSDKSTLIYLHTSRNLYSLTALILKKLGLIKGYVICPHGSYSKKWVECLGFRRAKALYIKIIENLIVENAISLHYLDKAEAKAQSSLIAQVPNFVVPNGIHYHEGSRERSSNSKHSDALRLIFVGRIHPQKNLLNLVHAMNEAQKQNVSLDIFGPIDDRSYYDEVKAAAPRNVVFKGFIKNEELSKRLGNYDAFVLCSVVEGVSIALLEALSVGLPVIYSTGLANSDSLDAHCVGINVGDASVSELVNGIRLMADGKHDFDEMSKNARNLCKTEYSSEAVAKSLDRNLKYYSAIEVEQFKISDQ